MAIDRERARAAGYTDAEIDAYEAEQAAKAQGPVAPEGTEPPPPPPPDPNQGDIGGVNAGELMATGLSAAGPFGLGVATAVAAPFAYRGAKKVLEAGRNMIQPGTRLNPVGGSGPSMSNLARTPTGVSTNIPVQWPQNAPTAPTAPTAPAPAPAAAAAPAATPPAQTAASQGNMAQRVAQIAYDKISGVAQRAAPYARAGMGALAALTPGNIGQDYPFPMSGPQRGQEINPATGRPWTREELSAYYASQR